MQETPEQIIERLVRGILERPQMHALSFEALEATLHALLTVLLEIRGQETGQPSDVLRRIAAKSFGKGSAAPVSRRLIDTHGPDIWMTSHPHHAEALGIYREWGEQILSPSTTTPKTSV